MGHLGASRPHQKSASRRPIGTSHIDALFLIRGSLCLVYMQPQNGRKRGR